MIRRLFFTSTTIYIFSLGCFSIAAYAFFKERIDITAVFITGLGINNGNFIFALGWFVTATNIILSFFAWIYTTAEDLNKVKLIYLMPAYLAFGALAYLENLPGPMMMPELISENNYVLTYRSEIVRSVDYVEYMYKLSHVWLFSSAFFLFSSCFSFTVWINAYNSNKRLQAMQKSHA